MRHDEPTLAKTLDRLAFTQDDYKAILSADPVANGTGPLDDKRFIAPTTTFQYEKPLQDGDCNNGICNCHSETKGFTNNFGTATTTKVQGQHTCSVGFGIGKKEGFDFKASDKMTWTNSSTTTNSTSVFVYQFQQAEISHESPSQ